MLSDKKISWIGLVRTVSFVQAALEWDFSVRLFRNGDNGKNSRIFSPEFREFPKLQTMKVDFGDILDLFCCLGSQANAIYFSNLKLSDFS